MPLRPGSGSGVGAIKPPPPFHALPLFRRSPMIGRFVFIRQGLVEVLAVHGKAVTVRAAALRPGMWTDGVQVKPSVSTWTPPSSTLPYRVTRRELDAAIKQGRRRGWLFDERPKLGEMEKRMDEVLMKGRSYSQGQPLPPPLIKRVET